jgi:hypothetical protein
MQHAVAFRGLQNKLLDAFKTKLSFHSPSQFLLIPPELACVATRSRSQIHA